MVNGQIFAAVSVSGAQHYVAIMQRFGNKDASGVAVSNSQGRSLRNDDTPGTAPRSAASVITPGAWDGSRVTRGLKCSGTSCAQAY